MLTEIIFDCPDEDDLINRLLDAAAAAGGGEAGNYSRVAFILRGQGTWRTHAGANPHIGTPGEVSLAESALIFMRCDAERTVAVVDAIRREHPYEEPFINVIKLDAATI